MAAKFENRVPLPVTQRAYTLRLRRSPGECPTCRKTDCGCWREALWATHEAVNKGAKDFGDWLLTLRGGLEHGLEAEPPVNDAHLKAARRTLEKELKNKADGPGKSRKPTKQEVRERAEEDRRKRIRDRRVLLALSWLSVEDDRGAPSSEFVVAKESDPNCGGKVKVALGEILKKRGVMKQEIEDWLRDCGPSLVAHIREDAVWVNRSHAFHRACSRWSSMSREDVREVLATFFGDTSEYLSLPTAPSDDDAI